MKPINLIALLSFSAFCAMADEFAFMTQEQTRAQQQYRTQSAYQMQVKQANMGTDSQIQNQMQNRIQTQMQSQIHTQAQSHMQNKMQQSRAGGGRH